MPITQDQRRQLNELLSQTTIRSDGTIDGQPNATLAALMNPQMQQQAQPMSSQELSALQMDNSEPDVFYGSGSPQQQAQRPQPRNFIRNESTGAVTDMDYAAPGGSRRGDIRPVTGAPISHDPWVDGPQVLSQRQLPDGRTVKTMRVPAMDGFGRQSSDVQEVIETPDYLNPAKLKELKYKKELAGLQPKAQEANWKEVESGGKLYLINSKTGEMKPAAIGGEQLAGKPAGQEKPMTEAQRMKFEKDLAKDYQTVNQTTATMDEIKKAIGSISTSKGLSAREGYSGYIPSVLQGKEAMTAENRINTLKGKVTQMGKAMASMAGAIGPMAVQEWKIVADAVNAIDPTAGNFSEQLTNIESQAEGAITRIKDKYEKQYVGKFDKYPQFKPGGPDAPAGGNLTPQDSEAMAWAMKNPNDPRAAQIKVRLGVR